MTTTPAPSIAASPLTGTSTGPFPTGFKYNAAEDVRVWLELAGVRQPDLTLSTHYTLTGATPLVDGGTVTLQAGVVPVGGWDEDAGDRIVMARRTVKRQALALPDAEGHKPRSTEAALDKLMRIAEEAADVLAVAVTVPVGETGPQLEALAARDGRLAWFHGDKLRGLAPTPRRAVGWDGDGNLTAVPFEVTVNGSTASIGSRLEAAVVTFSSPPAFLRTEGFLTAGDGGGALHQPVDDDPGHRGSFQTADGQWWEYVPEPGGWVNAKAFGGKSDGTGDMGPIVQDCVDYGRGLTVVCTGPTWRFATGVTVLPAVYPLDGFFAPSSMIEGDGPLATTFVSHVVGHLISWDSAANAADFRAAVGGGLRKVTLRGQGRTSGLGQSGLRQRAQYRPLVEDVLIRDFDLDGYCIKMLNGDKDSSNQPVMNRIRIENCGRIGLDVSPTSGNGNEISFVRGNEVFIHNCGTSQLKAVTAASNGAAMVLTVNGHGLATGERMRLYGFTGGFAAVNLTSYPVTVLSANTFSVPVNSTGFGTFASIAAVGPHIVSSAGMNWKGQEADFTGGGITECENASIQIPGGSGLASGFRWMGAIESCKGVGILITGLRGGEFRGQIYGQTNASGGQLFAGLLCDGGTHTIDHIEVSRMKMRATSHAGMGAYVGFARTGANAVAQSIRVRNTVWDSWGFAGHKRFLGIQFDPTPTQVELYFLSDTLAGLRPTGAGNGLDVRLTGPIGSGVVADADGEWVHQTIGAIDVLRSNAGLAISTRYYAYSYDATATFGRPDLEFSTTAPALDADSGKLVKTGDATRRFHASFQTDGTGKFMLTASGWLNPLRVPANRVGEPAYLWSDASAVLRISATAPTSDTDGNVVGVQT